MINLMLEHEKFLTVIPNQKISDILQREDNYEVLVELSSISDTLYIAYYKDEFEYVVKYLDEILQKELLNLNIIKRTDKNDTIDLDYNYIITYMGYPDRTLEEVLEVYSIAKWYRSIIGKFPFFENMDLWVSDNCHDRLSFDHLFTCMTSKRHGYVDRYDEDESIEGSLFLYSEYSESYVCVNRRLAALLSVIDAEYSISLIQDLERTYDGENLSDLIYLTAPYTDVDRTFLLSYLHMYSLSQILDSSTSTDLGLEIIISFNSTKKTIVILRNMIYLQEDNRHYYTSQDFVYEIMDVLIGNKGGYRNT